MPDRPDRGDEGGRGVRGRPTESLRIGPAGKLEQIEAFGAREREGPRDPAQRLWRSLHRAALLDPRAPGRADAGALGELLAPQTRRAAPAARRGRAHPLAMSADEFAEQPPLIRFQHGGYDTRIKFDLVTA